MSMPSEHHHEGLAADLNVFSDGFSTQLATVSGSVSAGCAATITVGIAA